MPPQVKFIHDAFVSYSTRDEAAVQMVVDALKERKLDVWMDAWDLPPGKRIQPNLAQSIEDSKVVLVFLGPSGTGPWQDLETEKAINLSMTRKKPVIPVILPEGPDPKELPGFLGSFGAVRFSQSPPDRDRRAIDRLMWGITEKKSPRKPPPPPPPPLADDIESDLQELSQTLRNDNITYFVGRSAGETEGQGDLPPGEISRRLLCDLNFIKSKYQYIVPPVEESASYFAVGRGDQLLESQVKGYFGPGPRRVSDVHRRLAELLATLSRRPPDRVRRRTTQLVITTCIDLGIELAMLSEGLAFTRITQHRLVPRLEAVEFKYVRPAPGNKVSFRDHEKADEVLVDRHDLASLTDLIVSRKPVAATASEPTLALDQLTPPYLYKFNGSSDVPDSCTLSSEQSHDFAWRFHKWGGAPRQVTEIIASSPILFLGCGILDPDFRLAYHTLLREQLEIPPKKTHYAVVSRPDRNSRDPYRRLESMIWQRVKTVSALNYRVKVIEEQCGVFLERLRKTFDPGSGP